MSSTVPRFIRRADEVEFAVFTDGRTDGPDLYPPYWLPASLGLTDPFG